MTVVMLLVPAVWWVEKHQVPVLHLQHGWFEGACTEAYVTGVAHGCGGSQLCGISETRVEHFTKMLLEILQLYEAGRKRAVNKDDFDGCVALGRALKTFDEEFGKAA